jgi:hypothetical protein
LVVVLLGVLFHGIELVGRGGGEGRGERKKSGAEYIV